jgi:guanylate kinase
MNRYENFISRIENVHRKGEQGVFFISGPSASGKDGLWKFIKEMKFIKKYNLHRPVSSTTRLPRIGERCGKDYFYVYPEDIIKSDGSYSENAINPIKFGSEKGRDI